MKFDWVSFIIAILFLALVLALPYVMSSNRSQLAAIGKDFHITMYGQDSKPIREWHSNGKVLTEKGSDGWYFTDKAS